MSKNMSKETSQKPAPIITKETVMKRFYEMSRAEMITIFNGILGEATDGLTGLSDDGSFHHYFDNIVREICGEHYDEWVEAHLYDDE